jgi:hypothetical protein
MASARKKTRTTAEFGDFQTPAPLASTVTEVLRGLGLRPQSVLEPTCGKGTFLAAAARSFPDATSFIGVDINPAYTETAERCLHGLAGTRNIEVVQGDFFTFDWDSVVAKEKGPWLILGNPPWVTNSSLGALASVNLPSKSNFHGRPGMEAVTGKSNFDISEWMLLQYVEWLKDSGSIAVLCKTSVARRLLLSTWRHGSVSSSRIYKIDAMAHFGAAVDACLFVMTLSPQSSCTTCQVFESLSAEHPSGNFSLCKGHLVSNASALESLESLWGSDPVYVWRSGIKHDCSRVMELSPEADHHVNGLGEHVWLEETFLSPMLKSSDIGNKRTQPRGVMIVTQERVGQETAGIAVNAPETWKYLNRHRSLLQSRGSVIYRNKPDFSIFGVGPYTFSPWKVAVASFYKKLLFVPVGPPNERTMVFDDTVYFLPCASEKEARFLTDILHSDMARDFFTSMVHWSDKRPLTIELLKRLSLKKLAVALGREAEYRGFTHAALELEEERQARLSFAS